MARKLGAESLLRREVAVGLIHNHDALKAIYDPPHLVAVDVVAGGIVGRADPYHLGVGIGGGEQALSLDLKTLVQ